MATSLSRGSRPAASASAWTAAGSRRCGPGRPRAARCSRRARRAGWFGPSSCGTAGGACGWSPPRRRSCPSRWTRPRPRAPCAPRGPRWLRLPRPSRVLLLKGLGGGDLAGPELGLEPGDVPTHLADAGVVAQLAGGELEAELEQLVLGLAQAVDEAAVVEVAEGFPRHQSASSLVTKRALIGSFWIARSMAARATTASGYDSSKSTRPGLTTATQRSGLPLPDPIRVSAGFCVTGLSGKTLIQTFPPRLMWRVMAIRAASIWRAVIHPGSSAWMPNSPKLTSVPPLATPVMRPRWCLRCATLRGINIYSSPGRKWGVSWWS